MQTQLLLQNQKKIVKNEGCRENNYPVKLGLDLPGGGVDVRPCAKAGPLDFGSKIFRRRSCFLPKYNNYEKTKETGNSATKGKLHLTARRIKRPRSNFRQRDSLEK